jgi:hypothetical protein
MHQSRANKVCTVKPNTFGNICALLFPNLRAQRRQRETTVRFAVHSRVAVPQSGTYLMSTLWRLEFLTGSACLGEFVRPHITLLTT